LIELLEGTVFGFASTLVMVLFEIPFWRTWGVNELVEWQLNGAIVSQLTRNLNPRISWMIASHLFHGAIAGLVFSLFLSETLGFPFSNVAILVDPLLYSVTLWLIFSVAPRRVYEVNIGFRSSNRALMLALSSHIIYGISLGLLLSFL
jgi:hypothetical protein